MVRNTLSITAQRGGVLAVVLHLALFGSAAATSGSSQAVVSLPAADRPIVAGFADLFVVGVERGADHEMLFGLVDVAFAPNGELYVLEERNHRVLVYGPDGGFRRRFGRNGQGPGEFQRPITLAFTRAEEVVVWDVRNRAYAIFSPQGEYLRQVRRADRQSEPESDSLRAWPKGGVAYLPEPLYLPQLANDLAGAPEGIERGTILRDPLVDQTVPEELLVVRHAHRRSKQIDGVLIVDRGPAFSPTARWDVMSNGRIAVADGVDYRVRLEGPAQGDFTILERPIPPRAARETDRERERQRVRDLHEDAANVRVGDRDVAGTSGAERGADDDVPMSEHVRRVVDAIEFSDSIPVIRELRVDGQDRLWIQRRGGTYFDDGPIDIVSPSGEYIGTLPPMPMPDAFGPEAMAAWMVRGDAVTVERVLVRRLPARLR